MAATISARILVVDDEPPSLKALCDILEDQGYAVARATNGADALDQLRHASIDVVLTDLMMPGMDGVELLGEALKLDPHLVGLLMTGNGTIETAVKAMQAGALDYILKPVKRSPLLSVVSRALQVRRLKLENFELRNTVSIHELNQAIAHTVDEHILLEKIADAALEQFDADEASVMLLTADERELFVASVRGGGRSELIGQRVAIGKGVAGWVAANREARAFDGEIVDSDVAPMFPRPEIQSSLCLPLVTRDKLIGVLNVNCTEQKRSFSPGQIRAMSIFTSAAAAGIESARLYEERRRADLRYREVLDMAADGIVSIDQDQKILIFNASAEKIFGYSAEEVLGQSLDLLLPESIMGTHRGNVESFELSEVQVRTMGFRGRRMFGRRKDGTQFYAEIAISKRTEQGSTLFTAVVRDVTERVQREDKIARLSRIRELHSDINSAIVRIHDSTDLCREACRVAVDTGQFRMAWIGFPEPGLGRVTPVCSRGLNDGYLQAVDEALEDKELDEGAAGRALREQRPIIANDIQNSADVVFQAEALARGYRSLAVLPLMRDGTAIGVFALYSAVVDNFDSDEVALLAELAGDIALALESIEKKDKLNFMARHDLVTRLPNRAAFMDQLGQYLRIVQEPGETFAVAVIDVERFRNVNETFGRHVGDSLLRQLAGRFGEVTQQSEMLAHLGADHFAIATGRVDRIGIPETAERLIFAGTSHPFSVGDTSLRLAVRAGIAVYPGDGIDGEELLHNAEAALRVAKSAGLGYQFYQPSMNADVAQRVHLESRLRGALDRQEFCLHYQPKVDLRTGDVVGLEALIRWSDPETGLVAPAKFVPLLEETGLITDIGNWAMREAMAASVRLSGGGGTPLRIAVNVSPIQLRDGSFVRNVESAVNEFPDGASRLALEITESVVMDDIEDNVRMLDAIRAKGIDIAIDDFGTGYSSLAYIGRLPVSVIKIDRSFVHGMTEEGGSKSIVETIILLTHTLGRRVVAEGVETEEQAGLLRGLGCDEFQGYLFSKPLPEEEIRKLLGLSEPKARPVKHGHSSN